MSEMTQPNSQEDGGDLERPITFADLMRRHGGDITVACDTEFKGPHTLTIQFAARVGEDVVVQVYASPAIPRQPDAIKLRKRLPAGIRNHCRRVIIREARTISADLSPVRVLADLFGITAVQPMDKVNGDAADPPADKTLNLHLVGHFWTADFFRVFGREFYASLVEHQIQGGTLTIEGHRLLTFREGRGYRRAAPVLEYAFAGDCLYAIGVDHFDTSLTFGKAKLEEHAQTFLGVGKLKDFGESEKSDMLATFHRDPCRAYAYAINDAVLTLLVREKMDAVNREMYAALGLAGSVPELQSTLGVRMAEMVVRSIAKQAEGSALLTRRGKEPPDGSASEVSRGKVRTLLKKGSGSHIVAEGLSVFREQTALTHGGLLFSRSPTQFFHEAPGMFRDVDLSGCYANVMTPMRLYAGQPVIHEPGSKGNLKTLKEAVEFLLKHAAGQDAWVIKASGKVEKWPNVLIPSTRNALTNANYKSRAAKRRAAMSRPKPARRVFAFDRADAGRKDGGKTAVYTNVVEAGVVAWPTWLMIQALPPEWRQEYERLEVDSILFYPKKMVANTGPEFDALVRRHTHDGTPWSATIDMDDLEQTIKRRIDDDHVTLGFDLGRLAKEMLRRRAAAKKAKGKGKAAGKGWKEAVNSLYGVTASPHLATSNVVAANVITATARALAFAMQMSLNGLQVITDGCTYRRDQVPAGTFADCLSACPEYTINRADYDGPFIDPATIPTDETFTDWYRGHVKRFFGIAGEDYDRLFSLHPLEHKETGDTKSVSFDGLCCDGSANYMKLTRDGEGWSVQDFKARSQGEEAKKRLEQWVVTTYWTDDYKGPPAITEAASLLKYKDAGRGARKALKLLGRGKLPEDPDGLLPSRDRGA